MHFLKQATEYIFQFQFQLLGLHAYLNFSVYALHLSLKIQSQYMRHVRVKPVEGCCNIYEKNHHRYLHKSATDTQVNVPCQQRIPWAAASNPRPKPPAHYHPT